MSLVFRPATSADGVELVKLLEGTSAKGRMRIVYSRRPDAYASFLREAPDARVFVWEEGTRIVGVVAASSRMHYVDGQPARGNYISRLQKAPEVEERLNLVTAFEAVCDPASDFSFFSVLLANDGIVAAFARGQRVPAVPRQLGTVTTFVIKTGGRSGMPAGRGFRPCVRADEGALTAFYGALAPQRGLFPVGLPWSQHEGLALSDFCVVTNDAGRIVAAGALWDQTDFRQYIIAGYSPLLRLARLLNPMVSRVGYPRLPKPNTVVVLPMACFMLAEPGDEEALVLGLLRDAQRRGYAQMVTGLASSSPFHHPFASRRHISFDSTIYQVVPSDDGARIDVPDISGIQCAFL
ncbi:MAG: hypothetical protein FWD59_02785 [Micrococcales bacterium]|nr:hypothetical protein [Micrococcales bacterium]